MRYIATALLTLLLAAGSVHAAGRGMVSLRSAHDVPTTTERLMNAFAQAATSE